MIKRNVEDRFRSLAASFPALVLSGARQAGKTTLLKDIFPNHEYVSLDLPSVAEQAERDPDLFFSKHSSDILIDEIQYAPGLFRHIKALIDRNRDRMGRFILTGSQNFSLMKGIADSLAGRCVILELENLSLEELKRHGTLASEGVDWISLLCRGQFPELWKRPTLPTFDFMSSYVSSYLERDLRQILKVTSLRDFERFLRLLAARSGSLLNKSDVAKDTGVSIKAIGDWISALEASGQIAVLEPWFENLGKRIVKTPKVYFRDSGLLCFLLGLDERSLPASSQLGVVWETFIFSEMRKVNDTLERPKRFWFYCDQEAAEVDFLIESGGRLSMAEAKWTESPNASDIRSMEKLSKRMMDLALATKAGKSWVISRSPNAYSLSKTSKCLNPFGIREMLEVEADFLE